MNVAIRSPSPLLNVPINTRGEAHGWSAIHDMKSSPQFEPKLSKREQEILNLAALGLTDKGIAARLWITSGTVGSYWVRIRHKLRTATRTEAVAVVLNRRLGAQDCTQCEALDTLDLAFQLNPTPMAVVRMADGVCKRINKAMAETLHCEEAKEVQVKVEDEAGTLWAQCRVTANDREILARGRVSHGTVRGVESLLVQLLPEVA